MQKTVTIRLDDHIYNLLKMAAQGERRSISNFLEHAALAYVTNEIYVSDEEMAEITSNLVLLKGIKKGLVDIKKGKYKIVESI